MLSPIQIIHWNSPKKLNVKNKHSDFFRNLYYTFVGFDGNLLRRQLFHCNDSSHLPEEVPVINMRCCCTQPFFFKCQIRIYQVDDDACYDLRKARDAKYRTHLFYLAYDAGKIDDNDITWVAQLSLDRLQMIEPLCRLWEGNRSCIQ